MTEGRHSSEGTNTAKQLALFKKRDVLSLEPDVVVLGFTVLNDAQTTDDHLDLAQG